MIIFPYRSRRLRALGRCRGLKGQAKGARAVSDCAKWTLAVRSAAKSTRKDWSNFRPTPNSPHITTRLIETKTSNCSPPLKQRARRPNKDHQAAVNYASHHLGRMRRLKGPCCLSRLISVVVQFWQKNRAARKSVAQKASATHNLSSPTAPET